MYMYLLSMCVCVCVNIRTYVHKYIPWQYGGVSIYTMYWELYPCTHICLAGRLLTSWQSLAGKGKLPRFQEALVMYADVFLFLTYTHRERLFFSNTYKCTIRIYTYAYLVREGT